MTTFALTDEHAQLGKISNNLEKHGEDDLITGFTLPLRLRIDRNQLVELMGEDFDKAVWAADGSCADWARRVLPLELDGEVYVEVAAALSLGGRELEFTDSRVTKLQMLAFAPGGITELKCHLYLRPGIGDENLLLQEYQEQEISVSISSGKLRVKSDKVQQQLPLGDPAPKTERELAHERGDWVEVITTVVDDRVEHEHPGFNDGRPIVHSVGAACFVCDGRAEEAIGRAVGTPEQERERAHEREREIAQQIADDRANDEVAA